jgi:hypothetical protein
MPRRNSPNDIQNLADLSRLSEIVTDKRLGQRAIAKKNRRNRHYDKQFIRNTLAHLPRGEILDADPAIRHGGSVVGASRAAVLCSLGEDQT